MIYDFRLWDAAVSVSSRLHVERSVGFVTRIEVEPNGEHVFEDFHGRLHVWDAVFDGPLVEAGDIMAFLDGDR